MKQLTRISSVLGTRLATLALSATLQAAGPSKLDVASTFNTNIFIVNTIKIIVGACVNN